MSYDYLNIPQMINIKLVETAPEKPFLEAVFKQSPEKPSFGDPGKTAGDVLYLEKANQLLISLGTSKELTTENYRQAGAGLSRWMIQNKVENVVIHAEDPTIKDLPGAFSAVCEGLLLASYRFERHIKKETNDLSITVWVYAEKDKEKTINSIKHAEITANAVNLARDWAHEPANIINPITLAERAANLAKLYGLKCTIVDEKDVENLGAGAIVAFGKGSHQSPARIIVLEYAGNKPNPETKPVVLVGKGLTFDSGGYSTKDPQNMVGMKYDKCGAMAVIGTLAAAAQLKIKTPVVGIIGAVENMMSSYSYRPDDILTTLSGKTVEVVSTDAEGRLVLADTLTYAQRNFPSRAVIDLATLTGGVVVALGRVRAGLLSNNNELSQQLIRSGEQTHERLWQLPMDEEYIKLVKSDDADIKNSSPVREAHTIVGDMFLKQFIDNDTAWAHIDIAGMADTPKDLPYSPKGATGFGIRLLIDYLERLD